MSKKNLITLFSTKSGKLGGGDLQMKKVNVKTNKTLHPQPERQTTDVKLPDSWNVPLRNPKFTGRDQELKEMSEILNRPDVGIVACVGVEGIGKTDLVAEYVHRSLEMYKGGIAWFSCNDRNVMLGEFLTLGVQLGVLQSASTKDNKHRQLDNQIKQWKTWLEDNERLGWLLVFDDVQIYDDVSDIFPKKGGKIIVISRDTKVVVDNVVVFNVFERLESLELKKNCPEPVHDDRRSELANVLGDLPLALDHASAYLRENVAVSVAQYLEMYRTRKKKLLLPKVPQVSETNKQNPLYITWDITMNKIQENSRLAPMLLCSLAFFAPNNIPHSLFEDFVQIFNSNRYESEDIEELLGKLHRYSLITYNSADKTLSMSSLFQEVVQLKVVADKDVDLLKNTLILFRLWVKKNQLSSMDKKVLRQLVPHFESLHKNSQEFCKQVSPNKCLERISFESDILMFHLGEVYLYSENFEKGLNITDEHLQFVELRGHLKDERFYLDSKLYETEMLSVIGKLYVTINGNLQILEGVANLYKNDDILSENVADLFIFLSSEYLKLDNESESTRYMKQVLQLYDGNTCKYNKILLKNIHLLPNNDKPEMVEQNLLALISELEKDISEVEKCCAYTIIRELLETSEYLFDSNDPVVRQLLEKPIANRPVPEYQYHSDFHIGILKKELGLFYESKILLEQTLEQIVVNDCLVKIPVMCLIAEVNYELLDNEQARTYLNEAEMLFNQFKSNEGDNLFKALQALGDIYFHAEQILKAREAYVKSLGVALSIYDPRHFQILKARLSVQMMSYVIYGEEATFDEIKKIVHINTSQQQHNKFFKHMSFILLEYSRSAFHSGHDRIAVQLLKDLLNLNFLYYYSKQLTINLNAKTLLLIFKNVGECSRYISRLTQNMQLDVYSFSLNISEMWLLFHIMNDHYKSLPHFVAEKVDENFFKLSCFWSDTVSISIHDESIEFICSFLHVIRQIPIDQLNLLLLLGVKGEILSNLNLDESASDIFNRQIRLLSKWKSFDQKLIATVEHNLGLAYVALGKDDEAGEILKKAHQKYVTRYGPFHTFAATILYDIGSLMNSLGRVTEAQRFLKESMDIQLKLNRAQHPDMFTTMRVYAQTLFAKKKNEAIELLQRGSQMAFDSVSSGNTSNADVYIQITTDLAVMFSMQKQWLDAKIYFDQVLQIQRQFYEKDNLEIADTCRLLADIATNLQDYTSSKDHLLEALTIYKNVLGERNYDVAETLFKLGLTLTRLNEFKDAYHSFETAFDIDDDKNSICWIILRLGYYFWLLKKKREVNIISIWHPMENVRESNDLKCRDEELFLFWSTLFEGVYKFTKIFSKHEKKRTLNLIKNYSLGNIPFNSPRVVYLLNSIADAFQKYINKKPISKEM